MKEKEKKNEKSFRTPRCTITIFWGLHSPNMACCHHIRVWHCEQKVAKVVPLFKAGDRSLFSNYIPVITIFQNIGEII